MNKVVGVVVTRRLKYRQEVQVDLGLNHQSRVPASTAGAAGNVVVDCKSYDAERERLHKQNND